MPLIDPKLMGKLVCPDCHGELEEWEAQQRLVCKKCGKRYPVRDGIAVMLIDEAELPEGGTQSQS
jgi:hypothetical protein